MDPRTNDSPPRSDGPLDGRRRLLALVASTLLVAVLVLGARLSTWWQEQPGVPVEEFVAESRSTGASAEEEPTGLAAEQVAFRQRLREEAAREAEALRRSEAVRLDSSPWPGSPVDRSDEQEAEEREEERETENLPFTFDDPRSESRNRDEDAERKSRYAEALWREAIRLRQEKRFTALEEILGRLLAAEPGHRAARAWRDALPRMRADQRRAAEKVLRERLGGLESAIESRRLDRVQALWGGAPDPRTRSFFEGLFADSPALRVSVRANWLEVEGESTAFLASITIERRGGRGRRDLSIDRYDWRGRLEGGHFAAPFPG